jgi:hypothetical protein
VLSASSTPIQVTGKIFYGIPEGYVSEEQLNVVFERVVLKPMAGRVSASVKSVGQGLAKEQK